jgi:hypothetical protein
MGIQALSKEGRKSEDDGSGKGIWEASNILRAVWDARLLAVGPLHWPNYERCRQGASRRFGFSFRA